MAYSRMLTIVLVLLYVNNFDCFNFNNFNKPPRATKVPKVIEEKPLEATVKKASKRFKNIKPITILPIPLILLGSQLIANADFSILVDPHRSVSVASYWRYFVAGSISASFSHAVTVPFDVVKTRIQVSNDKVKKDLFSMGKKIINEDGVGMLFQGMVPTCSGYLVQGSIKYGLYEMLKPIVKTFFENDGIHLEKLVIFMIAGGLAEMAGSSVLTPFEAARIRLVSQPNFASNLLDCVQRMVAEEGVGSLFLGLPAILLKNVPYTILQLSTFEVMATSVYSYLSDIGLSQDEALQYRFFITSGTALVAAVLASLASQPGDTLLSYVNKGVQQTEAPVPEKKPFFERVTGFNSNTDSFFSSNMPFQSSSSSMDNLEIPKEQLNPVKMMVEGAQELGWSGLFTGTQARLVHVSVIVVVQLLCYDYVKQLVGIPVTGFH